MTKKRKVKKSISHKERFLRSLRSRDSDELIEMILNHEFAECLGLDESDLHFVEDELAMRDIYFGLDGRLLDNDELDRLLH